MPENEINITAETLFELLQREKNRAELQELGSSFFKDVQVYLSEKYALISPNNKDFSIKGTLDREKIEKQIENVYETIKKLFERREHKIVEMAIIASITGSADYKCFLEEEKQLFDELVKLFKSFRKKIMSNIYLKEINDNINDTLNNNKIKQDSAQNLACHKNHNQSDVQNKIKNNQHNGLASNQLELESGNTFKSLEETESSSSSFEGCSDSDNNPNAYEDKINESANSLAHTEDKKAFKNPANPAEDSDSLNRDSNLLNIKGEKGSFNNELSGKKDDSHDYEMKLVRFIASVPSFVGPDLEVYGPFDEDDSAIIPAKIADILIKKSRAEEIKK